MADNYKGEDAPPFGLPGSALTARQDIYLCPYNMQHEIRKDQIDSHLDKCRTTYVLNEFAKGNVVWPWAFCKYNKAHNVYGPELLFHEAHCEDQWKCAVNSNLADATGDQEDETEVDQQMEIVEDGAEAGEFRGRIYCGTMIQSVTFENMMETFLKLFPSKQDDSMDGTEEEEEKKVVDLSHLGAASLLAQGLVGSGYDGDEEPSLEETNGSNKEGSLGQSDSEQEESMEDALEDDNGKLDGDEMDIDPVKIIRKPGIATTKYSPRCTTIVQRAYEKLNMRLRKRTRKYYRRGSSKGRFSERE
ncbi:unnamed protein product [Orchesella dallaii]|uniref:CHHC U11-48K-type domain-containing protein n=1 Tax=Orchesella dallaii TaxID=48710 RepID=A0ABP1REN0_9HEXA